MVNLTIKRGALCLPNVTEKADYIAAYDIVRCKDIVAIEQVIASENTADANIIEAYFMLRTKNGTYIAEYEGVDKCFAERAKQKLNEERFYLIRAMADGTDFIGVGKGLLEVAQ